MKITKIGPEQYKPPILNYATTPTTFGNCFAAFSQNQEGCLSRLHFLKFFTGHDVTACLDALLKTYPGAEVHEEASVAPRIAEIIANPAKCDIEVMLKGTPFQIEVWEALLAVKSGTTVSYEAIAGGIGRVTAVRAVANAIARNPIAYLIPCHRVVTKDGLLGNYSSGGPQVKFRMLKSEGAPLH